MPFPDVVNKDFAVDGKKNKDVKEILDYAVGQWNSRESRIKRINSLYNSHNGIVSTAETEAITKSTGKLSKTKYVQYRLGRTKLKQLHGEFLEINIDPSVRTTNREAVNRKMDKYKQLLGLALAKPQIEKVREMGYNVFPGMKIPDRNDKAAWDPSNFKLANEIVMQRIIDDKMSTLKLKSTFYQNFIDLTITSEIFGKVERNSNGIDTYRYIPVKYALYEENIGDIFLEKSPYLGEVRPMFMHEILTSKEWKLNSEEVGLLKSNTISGNNTKSTAIDMNANGLINVYTIQWKAVEPVRMKISPVEGSKEPFMLKMSNDYYNKNVNKIKRDVADGLYTVETYYQEVLWTASRIGQDIYTEAKKEENIIQVLNENNKYVVEFDYSGMLFNTIDGVRVSVQEIIQELEKIYDEIRFHISKEMKKIKGNVITFDEAFLPKGKTVSDVIHSISEDGMVRYNSSAEGNVSGTEIESNKVGINAINLGNNQNLLILLQQAMDIERVMDRVTGMNENRQGLTKATTTATANVNNIEASRSMTYDLFYFMQHYIEKVLMKLAEKTKLNVAFLGADNRKFIYDDNEIMYMLSTKDIDFDNYGVSVTDGKREKDILNKLEMMFPQEINAGNLRSKDVARFWTESSFAAALRVLDNAQDQITRLRENEIRIKNETAEKSLEQQVKLATEEREDKQQHDRDMALLNGEIEKENITLKESMTQQREMASSLAKSFAEPESAF